MAVHGYRDGRSAALREVTVTDECAGRHYYWYYTLVLH